MIAKSIVVTMLSLIFILHCSSDNIRPINSSNDTEDDSIFITDLTGRKWDVTHAFKAYNMNPNYYNFGLGVGAIPSVDNPKIMDESNAQFPSSDRRLEVFGVSHNGEERAYSTYALARHEVFNDKYPGGSHQYVAVAY